MGIEYEFDVLSYEFVFRKPAPVADMSTESGTSDTLNYLFSHTSNTLRVNRWRVITLTRGGHIAGVLSDWLEGRFEK
jgi:hypothetical protein